MSLALRVMFLQGALLRQRSEIDVSRFPAKISWWCIGAGLLLILVGILRVGENSLVGALFITGGVLLTIVYAEPLIKVRRVSPHLAITVSWAAASLFLLLMPALVIAAALTQDWIALGYALLIAVSMGATLLRALEFRYMWFAGRRPPFPEATSLIDLPRQAYFEIPKHLLFTKEPER
jgi:hypothetical protein